MGIGAYGTSNYMPFGSMRSTTGSSGSSYKFTDQELDSESGLYNYNARLYDPEIGRFISADPIVPDPFNPQSLNRYSYVLNNPLIYTDPSGYQQSAPGQDEEKDYPEFTLDEIVIYPPDMNIIYRTLRSANYGRELFERLNTPTWNIPNPNSSSPTGASAGNGSSGGGSSSKECKGSARILEGNPDHIGDEGGFVPVKVSKTGAAIATVQWGGDKGPLRPYLQQISGKVDGIIIFDNICEVIGGKAEREKLLRLNPGILLIELPGGKDLNVKKITVTLPDCLKCPEGTK